jgi:ketosteroid isomerase-like protein
MSAQLDTTKAEENRSLLERGYAAFAAGDLATVEAMFHSDAIWHAQRLGLLSGDHEGWGSIASFFMESMALTDGTFHIEVEDILASEDRVAVTLRSKASRIGRTLDSHQVHLYRIVEGKVAEIWQFVDDGMTTQEFWS